MSEGNLQLRTCSDCISRSVCQGTQPCEDYEFAAKQLPPMDYQALVDKLIRERDDLAREVMLLKCELEARKAQDLHLVRNDEREEEAWNN